MSKTDDLVSMIENANFERDKAKNDYDQLRVKYESLKKSYNNLNSTFAQTRTLSLESINIKNLAEKKLKENYTLLLESEKKYSSVANKVDRLEHENALLNSQLEHFKLIYEEMENRKNAEVKCLEGNLTNLKMKYENIKKENDESKNKISDLNLKIKQLQTEKDLMKNDNDHLTKIIENSNLTVQTAEEKSKQMDSIVKGYQKQINESNLEKEKLGMKINMQVDQMNKMNDDINRILNEKNEQFDNALTEVKNKYETILSDKNEEMNLLKGDYITMKIERDKYVTEYNILKNEIEKMSSTFREENEKNMKRNKENEDNTMRIQNHFQDKIRLITERNDFLEKENQTLTKQLNELKEQEKKRNDLYGRLTKNESELNEEIAKMKNTAANYEKENLELKKKINKLEIKYKELEDSSMIRIKALGSTLNNRNDIYNNIEKKVYEIMIEQEGITTKMKNEYLSFQDKEKKTKEINDIKVNKSNDDEY